MCPRSSPAHGSSAVPRRVERCRGGNSAWLAVVPDYHPMKHGTTHADYRGQADQEPQRITPPLGIGRHFPEHRSHSYQNERTSDCFPTEIGWTGVTEFRE